MIARGAWFAAGVTAGLKPSGRPDVALVVNDGPDRHAAAVFTTNRVEAAPVTWSRQVVADGRLVGTIAAYGPSVTSGLALALEEVARLVADQVELAELAGAFAGIVLASLVDDGTIAPSRVIVAGARVWDDGEQDFAARAGIASVDVAALADAAALAEAVAATGAARVYVHIDLDVLDPAGKKSGTAQLPADVFGVATNVPLIHQVVVAQLAAARQGTHATKTRGEVRGGGRKPYKQKGTGRARQGSRRAPQWTGGGVVHGPTPHGYSQRTPKKMIRAALNGALSDRVRNERIHVITELVEGQTPSTKAAAAATPCA